MARSIGITALCAALSVGAASLTADAAGAPRHPVRAEPAEACGLRGGLYLPDARSCLGIGGLVTAEAARTAGEAPSIVPAAPRRCDRGGQALRARGRVDIDVRTDTPLGPARAFLSIQTR